MLKDAAGNVLIGVYHHPATGDPQAGTDEMTINFNYNQFMTQWLLLGPGLIDWVTGATHLGLYRNYSTIHVDDMFTPDDAWRHHHPRERLHPRPTRCACAPIDVDTAATWSRTNNYRLDILFNGGNATANADSRGRRPAAGQVPDRTTRDR